jgi:hypothetical protein
MATRRVRHRAEGRANLARQKAYGFKPFLQAVDYSFVVNSASALAGGHQKKRDLPHHIMLNYVCLLLERSASRDAKDRRETLAPRNGAGSSFRGRVHIDDLD